MKESKKKLLEAAKSLFATNGYDATSTRAIAQKAGVNISAIVYYFGGKLGLYNEILQEIMETTKKELNKKINITEILAKLPEATSQEAEEILYSFITELCLLLLSNRMEEEDIRLFLFEYNIQENTDDILEPKLISPVYDIFSQLILKASDYSLTKEDALLYNFQLFSQMFIFKSRKHVVLNRLGWASYGEEEIQKIIASIINQARVILNLQKQ